MIKIPEEEYCFPKTTWGELLVLIPLELFLALVGECERFIDWIRGR